MGKKKKTFSNPVPLVIYDHFEWKQTDVVVPPSLRYKVPFIGTTTSMLAPFHKESGKKAYFFRYRGDSSCDDVRMKLVYDGKQYYNSVVLAYKLFPDSDFVEIKDDKVHVLKVLDHINPLVINGWSVKIDSEKNLRLATLGENAVNTIPRRGSIKGIYYNGCNGYTINWQSQEYAQQSFNSLKYGGLNHAKLAALNNLKELIEKKNSPFLTAQLKHLQAERLKLAAQVKRIDKEREKVYGLSFVELGDLKKICNNSNKGYAIVNKQWVELIQKMKIKSNSDLESRINKITTIKLFNDDLTSIHNVHHSKGHLRRSFRYQWVMGDLDFRSEHCSTALEALYVGLEFRQELCRILGKETTFHLTEEQIEIINLIHYG